METQVVVLTFNSSSIPSTQRLALRRAACGRRVIMVAQRRRSPASEVDTLPAGRSCFPAAATLALGSVALSPLFPPHRCRRQQPHCSREAARLRGEAIMGLQELAAVGIMATPRRASLARRCLRRSRAALLGRAEAEGAAVVEVCTPTLSATRRPPTFRQPQPLAAVADHTTFVVPPATSVLRHSTRWATIRLPLLPFPLGLLRGVARSERGREQYLLPRPHPFTAPQKCFG